MPRKGDRKPWPDLGPRDGTEGLTSSVQGFLGWMQTTGYSPNTIVSYGKTLRLFLAWCAERDIARPREVSFEILERYQHFVSRHRKANGNPLGLRTQRDRMESLRSFFRYATKHKLTDHNPAADLDLPRLGQRLPMYTLSHQEVARVMAQPDLSKPDGLRDRSMPELMYSTGVRRGELVGLRVFDVEIERALLRVYAGKGNKDRVVPVGESAVRWLSKYLDEVRPRWLTDARGVTALYITYEGKAMSAGYLTHLARRYLNAAGIDKPGACHILRHSMATGMLERGADIRFVQAMLGHANIRATQLYTHVSIEKLREVHTATHPASSKPEPPDA